MSASNPYEAKPVVFDSNKSVQEVIEAGESSLESQDVSTGAEKVPVGSVREILEWVGEDSERALQALEVETSGAGRASLIKPLKALLDA